MNHSTEGQIQRLHQDLWIFSILILICGAIDISIHKILISPVFAFLGIIFCLYRHTKISKQRFFNPANTVTTIRGILLIVIVVISNHISSLLLGISFTVFCLLDIVDGYLARKFNASSLIGEYFDKEMDALFVLFATIFLYQTNYAGPWVLTLGFIRYIYFIILYFFIQPDSKEIKDRYAKYIAIFLFVSLLLSFFIPSKYGGVLLFISTILITYSFVRGALIQLNIWKGS